MRKGLWLVACLLVIITLLAGSCGRQPSEQPTQQPSELPTEQPTEQPTTEPSQKPTEPPEGMESPRELTDSEKAKVIEIALNDPEVSEWLEKESEYRIRISSWHAIVWKSSGDGYSEWRTFPYYDVETNPNYKLVPESARWYPGLTITVGEWMIMLLQLAVDLDRETVIMSFGPNPSPGSPGRFQKKEPRVGIMVESDTVEVGSSLLVSGSNFEPNQKVWIEIEFRGRYGLQVYCEADEDGSIHPIIEVPPNTAPGDYGVKIYTGEHIHDRQLLTTLLIHIQ